MPAMEASSKPESKTDKIKRWTGEKIMQRWENSRQLEKNVIAIKQLHEQLLQKSQQSTEIVDQLLVFQDLPQRMDETNEQLRNFHGHPNCWRK